MSGSTLHDGLEYQAMVTALAAVELMVLQGYTSKLQIEPPSDEDVEADLTRDLEDVEPAPAETRSDTETSAERYTLIIQSKRRDGGVWTAPNVERLLGHGERREKAGERLLRQSDTRYLLVSSGTLVSKALTLRVSQFGEWPDLADVERRFQKYSAADRCRVGVLDGLTEAELRARLDRRLRANLFMPFDQVGQCIDALIDTARRRGRGDHTGIWTVEEVSELLQQWEALLPGQIDGGSYVAPRNYLDLKETLEAQQAVLILGPSGTGKTRTAERLRDELRHQLKGARSIALKASLGPGQLADAVSSAPAIVYIEDPWGPVALQDNAAAWTKALHDADQKRKRGVWLIITSRQDVFNSARVPETLFTNWRVTLDASHYGSPERRRMLEDAMKALPLRLRGLAAPYLDRALLKLSTPLEIRTFVTGLAAGPSKSESALDLVIRCTTNANSRQYQEVVAAQIDARHDHEAATVLWMLFKCETSLTRDDVIRARRAITRHTGKALSIEPLLDFLRAGQSLDQSKDSYSYAHPQVEAGLRDAVWADAAVFEASGKALIEALVAEPGEATIGPLLAARIVAGVAREDEARAQDLMDTLSPDTRKAIDQCLLTALRALNGRAFKEAFRAAAATGSRGILHFDLARWFLAPAPIPDSDDLSDLMPRWLEPAPSPAWKAELAGSGTAKAMLEKAVIEVAGDERDFYPKAFGASLSALGADFTGAFGQLALQLVGHGYDPAVQMAVVGALPRLASLEDAVVAAQQIYAADSEPARDDWRLDLANGVFDDDYSMHLSSGEDEGWSAGEITSAWVGEKRRKEGWRALAAFPRAELLAWDWASAIAKDPAPIDPEEFRTLAAATLGSKRERAVWNLAANRMAPGLGPMITSRLASTAISPETRIALRHAQGCCDAEAMAADQARLVSLDDIEHLLQLHIDLTTPNGEAVKPALQAAQATLQQSLPPQVGKLVAAILQDGAEASPDDDVVALAGSVGTSDGQLAGRLLRASAGQHPNFDALYAVAIDCWTHDDSDVAEMALDAALAAGRNDLVRAALSHPVGSIVQKALARLGPTLTISELLSLPGLRGHPVREDVIEILGGRLDDAASTALLHFCSDTYNQSQGGPPEHPLARRAATLLSARTAIPEALLRDIKAKTTGLQDPRARRPLLVRLAQESRDLRAWLLELALSDHQREAVREDAVIALLQNRSKLEDALIEEISAETLLTVPGGVAALLCVLVASKLPLLALKQMATRLNSSNDRRGLIVLLSGSRQPALDDHLRSLLPPEHPASRLIGHTGALVPRSALDDLAEQSIVQMILMLLQRFFEPRPKQLWGAQSLS